MNFREFSDFSEMCPSSTSHNFPPNEPIFWMFWKATGLNRSFLTSKLHQVRLKYLPVSTFREDFSKIRIGGFHHPNHAVGESARGTGRYERAFRHVWGPVLGQNRPKLIKKYTKYMISTGAGWNVVGFHRGRNFWPFSHRGGSHRRQGVKNVFN